MKGFGPKRTWQTGQQRICNERIISKLRKARIYSNICSTYRYHTSLYIVYSWGIYCFFFVVLLCRATGADEHDQYNDISRQLQKSTDSTNVIDTSRIQQIESRLIGVGGFVDSNTCWDNLKESDVNRDGVVDRIEYVTFAKLEAIETNSPIEEVTTFADLPLAYQLAYITTSCLCQDPMYGGDAADEDCCKRENATIRVPVATADNSSETGTDDVSTSVAEDAPILSETDEAYLYAACVLTSAAAETVRTSPAPSIAPSNEAVPPTAAPSFIPTTSPTAGVTISPTFALTNQATTIPPTAIYTATKFPTGMPSVSTTESPTGEETNVPSATPPATVPITTNVPTPIPLIRTNATVDYQISIKNGTSLIQSGTFETEYLSNLQLGMNRLATTIANKGSQGRRILKSDYLSNLDATEPIHKSVRMLQAEDTNIQLELPTEFQDVRTIPCPTGPLIRVWGENEDPGNLLTLDAGDLCQEVTAVVRLVTNSRSGSEIQEFKSQFENDVYNAIYDGVYQSQLDDIYEGEGFSVTNPIIVLTGYMPSEPTLNPNSIDTPIIPSDNSFSSGAIAAITLGAVAGILLPIVLFLSRRTKPYNDYNTEMMKKPEYQEYDPDGDTPDDLEMMMGESGGRGGNEGRGRKVAAASRQGPGDELRLPSDGMSIADTSQFTDFAVKSSTGSLAGAIGATSLGAAPLQQYSNQRPQQSTSSSDFHGKGGSKRVIETMMLAGGNDIVAEPGVDADDDKFDDASSNAGSSGWSSSAGISSLNTGSIDDSIDIAAAAGATLAGIGLASGTFRQQQQRSSAVSNSRSSSEFNAETTSGDDDSVDDHNNTAAVAKTTVTTTLSNIDSVAAIEPSENTMIIRDQIESLIESGDWAAVGATAALLAAASDSQSVTTGISRTSRSALSETNSAVSVDVARAAELDHLVDSGDWEGVVLAAARFEAAAGASSANAESAAAGGIITTTTTSITSGDGSRENRSRANSSSQDSSLDDSVTGTGTFTGTFDPSISTSVSDDPSRAAKVAEYRAEVEALVRRVVPEEIENVDEMMNQFKGREEELIETLRTMQERAAAQKARQAGHRNAKLEARRTVQRGVVPGAGAVAQRVASLESTPITSSTSEPVVTVTSGPGSNAGEGITISTAGAAVTTESTNAPFGVTTRLAEDRNDDSRQIGRSGSGKDNAARQSSSPDYNQTALDHAIAVGDWKAAGDAAGMLSGSSATSISSGELDRLANANYSTTSTEGSETWRKQQLSLNADRAAELDAIIDKGDWNAVVSIANRYTEEDSHLKHGSTVGGVSRMSKEEEDALREAELWMKIAEQKKAEGAMDAGASDAAEWAIQRSLSQLREAEEKNKAKSLKYLLHHGDGEDEV